MQKCLEWIDALFTDESIFPVDATVDFPDDFLDNYINKIYTFMFRVFAILYHCHYELLVANQVANLLNTTLKHFMFFTLRFKLILDDEELQALATPVSKIRKDYIAAWKRHGAARELKTKRKAEAKKKQAKKEQPKKKNAE